VSEAYVHGYDPRENIRLQDQAGTLVELLHSDTSYPAGSMVLEAGCGVGAQTVTLAQRSPGARFTSVDISADSIAEAKKATDTAGFTNVQFQQADIFALSFAPASFDHVFLFRSGASVAACGGSGDPQQTPQTRWHHDRH
jgi:ubiquinone/menaquinone biosynthesis C-methylase UbiE